MGTFPLLQNVCAVVVVRKRLAQAVTLFVARASVDLEALADVCARRVDLFPAFFLTVLVRLVGWVEESITRELVKVPKSRDRVPGIRRECRAAVEGETELVDNFLGTGTGSAVPHLPASIHRVRWAVLGGDHRGVQRGVAPTEPAPPRVVGGRVGLALRESGRVLALGKARAVSVCGGEVPTVRPVQLANFLARVQGHLKRTDYRMNSLGLDKTYVPESTSLCSLLMWK